MLSKIQGELMGQVLFGPVHSRRFRLSLGVDLSPMFKQCNFDCLYCELEGARGVDGMRDVVPVSVVMSEIKEAFSKHERYDVLTFSANGEPTLYPHLLPLLKEVKLFLQTIESPPKLLILSNGSLFGDSKVQEALMEFDIVKFSLDAVSETVFKKIDRASASCDIKNIIEGIKSFKKRYKGELIAEVLLVKGVNDGWQEVSEIAQTLREIEPLRVDLGSIDRPPAYKVKPLSHEELEAFLPLFEGLSVNLPSRKSIPLSPRIYNEQEILDLLKRRPLNEQDLKDIFTEESCEILKRLESQGVITLQEIAGVPFYCVKS